MLSVMASRGGLETGYNVGYRGFLIGNLEEGTQDTVNAISYLLILHLIIFLIIILLLLLLLLLLMMVMVPLGPLAMHSPSIIPSEML